MTLIEPGARAQILRRGCGQVNELRDKLDGHSDLWQLHHDGKLNFAQWLRLRTVSRFQISVDASFTHRLKLMTHGIIDLIDGGSQETEQDISGLFRA